MGLFNYQFQGYALCAKWILRALEGHEAWKLLVWHCILQGLPLGKKSWKGLNLQTLLTAPINIKISGSFVIKSIWKPWESLKPWLSWNVCAKSVGASLSSLNVWWSLIFSLEGFPLANVQWVRALHFHRKGIRVIHQFFDSHTKHWYTWVTFKNIYGLKADDKATFDIVVDQTPFSI